jgi:diketogulonate reductase-like aldo/keto reductase
MLKLMGAGLAGSAFGPAWAIGQSSEPLQKPIPCTGELLPVIGMGTWQTFNVGRGPVLRKQRTQVLKAFFDHGGGMIDSSPMYGSSQAVVGYGLEQLGMPEKLFAADKVWTSQGDQTRQQMAESRKAWGIEQFDLMQVHNLVAWQPHLKTLQQMKEAGDVRYIGITTSHGRRHGELERVMERETIDFVQLTYNLTHREVENRLLPLAQQRGIAVIANRPFDGGRLVKRLQANHQLPRWAAEIDCPHWPAFLLKFIVSHPAVTCAIPATTKAQHMRENKEAGHGRLPDAKMRRRMIEYIESL